MLKIESWPPTPENTSFSESGLLMLNHATECGYDAQQVARDCGALLASIVDYDTANEIVASLSKDERLRYLGFGMVALNGINMQRDLAGKTIR